MIRNLLYALGLAVIGLLLVEMDAHAGDKPLVLESGQFKVLPGGTTLQLNASTTAAAPLNVGQGSAPSSPNNGDCWITTSGLYCQINGSTVGPFSAGSSGVTTTGSPASGNLTKFSGTNTITNGDLSGDCTTSGTLAITCTKTNGTSFATSATTDTTNATNITSGNLPAARMTTNLSSALDTAIGSTRGAILERGASGWALLPPSSTSGFVLTSNGTGADPTYQAAGGSTPAYVTAAAAATLMRSFGGL